MKVCKKEITPKEKLTWKKVPTGTIFEWPGNGECYWLRLSQGFTNIKSGIYYNENYVVAETTNVITYPDACIQLGEPKND